MLNSLRIQNFKSWKDTGDIQFGAITGFFGTNSSGKTSILQFLLMLKQTVESSDNVQVLNFGDERSYTELGTIAVSRTIKSFFIRSRMPADATLLA